MHDQSSLISSVCGWCGGTDLSPSLQGRGFKFSFLSHQLLHLMRSTADLPTRTRARTHQCVGIDVHRL